jgi:hypothetical protein
MLREIMQQTKLPAKLHAELQAKLPSEKVCAKLEVLDKLEELDVLNVGKVARTGHMRSRSVCRNSYADGTRSVPATLMTLLSRFRFSNRNQVFGGRRRSVVRCRWRWGLFRNAHELPLDATGAEAIGFAAAVDEHTVLEAAGHRRAAHRFVIPPHDVHMVRQTQIDNAEHGVLAFDGVVPHASVTRVIAVAAEAWRPVVFDVARMPRGAEVAEDFFVHRTRRVQKCELCERSHVAHADGALGRGDRAEAVSDDLRAAGIHATSPQRGGHHPALAAADTNWFVIEGRHPDGVPVPTQNVVTIAATAFEGLGPCTAERRANLLRQRVPAVRDNNRGLRRVNRIARMRAAGVVQQHAMAVVAPSLQDGGVQAAADRESHERERQHELAAKFVHPWTC